MPCVLITSDRFEGLARTLLNRDGEREPHLAIGLHPFAGKSRERSMDQAREVAAVVVDMLFGRSSSSAG